MKTIAVYANTCAIGSYKSLWPQAFYDGLQHHKDWQSKYVKNKQLTKNRLTIIYSKSKK